MSEQLPFGVKWNCVYSAVTRAARAATRNVGSSIGVKERCRVKV